MKKMLFTALAAALFFTACNTQSDNTKTEEVAPTEAAQTAPISDKIVYLQMSKILSDCDLAQTEGKVLEEKNRKTQESLARRERNLQNEANQLQEKYQKGLMTTADAQKKQQSLERRAQSLQASAQKELQALEEENNVFGNRMKDLVDRAVEEINAEKHYKFILEASLVVHADPALDITTEVLAKVNELYAADKKSNK